MFTVLQNELQMLLLLVINISRRLILKNLCKTTVWRYF